MAWVAGYYFKGPDEAWDFASRLDHGNFKSLLEAAGAGHPAVTEKFILSGLRQLEKTPTRPEIAEWAKNAAPAALPH